MAEEKYTDEQIVKALACCGKPSICVDCNFGETEGIDCISQLANAALSIIERQKEENKRLKNALETAVDCIGECEHACHKVYNSRIEAAVKDWGTYAEAHNIDNLLKEMVGES